MKIINLIFVLITVFVLPISTQAAEEALDDSLKSDAVVEEILEQKIDDDTQALAETLNTGVTSWCRIYANGQGIRILAQNTSNRNRQCTISCPYKNRNGYSGTHRASGTVGANSRKHVWSHRRVSGERFTLNGRGSQSCR